MPRRTHVWLQPILPDFPEACLRTSAPYVIVLLFRFRQRIAMAVFMQKSNIWSDSSGDEISLNFVYVYRRFRFMAQI